MSLGALHPAWGCLIIPGEALGNAFVAGHDSCLSTRLVEYIINSNTLEIIVALDFYSLGRRGFFVLVGGSSV